MSELTSLTIIERATAFFRQAEDFIDIINYGVPEKAKMKSLAELRSLQASAMKIISRESKG